MSRLYRSRIFLILIFFIFLLPFFIISIKADNAYYKTYNVRVDVDPDSTFIVTEDVTIYFQGTYKKVFRGITLSDREAENLCAEDNTLQCGGFEYLQFLGFYDPQGNIASSNDYTLETVYENGEDRLLATWNFAPDGRYFTGEDFNYQIKYKVYGGLGFFDDYDLFYWDILPPERPTSIQSSLITINLPEGYVFSEDALKVLSNFEFDYEIVSSSPLVIRIEDISVSEDITILLKINKGIIKQPGSLNINSDPSPIDITINGVVVEDVEDSIGGIPAGEVNLTFSESGYIPESMDITLIEGETKDIDVTLEMDPLGMILMVITVLCTVCSCLLLPFGLFFIYLNWYRKGRDPKYKDTIVPLYSPPDKIPPYLLGSLKDEMVDMIDITATLIDVARRGYIKIREFESKGILGFKGESDYEFMKLKEFDDLGENEKKIMESIFSTKKSVIVSLDLKNFFYLKVPDIIQGITSEMVSKGYFKDDPENIRNRYRLMGIGLSTICFIGLTIFGGILLVVFPLLILLVDGIVLGVALTIIATHMPAKTDKGAKVLNEIKGFRMYLNTAERFRVQDLTPETFEKFLPYAMVFGIEKEWGERFKDIYKSPPEWYEASSFDTFNTIYMINSLNHFTSSTTSALAYSQKASSGSSGGGFSGGGWSGGGGFSGGFSGGGGGGGSSGWG